MDISEITPDYWRIEGNIVGNVLGTFSDLTQFSGNSLHYTEKLSTNQRTVESGTAGFYVSATHGGYTSGNSTTQKHSGSYSYKLTSTYSGTETALDLLIGNSSNLISSINAGKNYTFSCYLRPVLSAAVSIRAKIFWYTSGNALISETDGNYTSIPANQFTQLTLSTVSPATTAKAYVMVDAQNVAQNDGFYYDDGSFQEINQMITKPADVTINTEALDTIQMIYVGA